MRKRPVTFTVSHEDYSKILESWDKEEEELSMSEFIRKAVLFYIDAQTKERS